MIKAWILTDAGRTIEAADMLEQAGKLNEKYYQLSCYAARLRMLAAGRSKQNDDQATYGDVSLCLDNGGAGNLVTPSNFGGFVKHYQSAKDWSRLVELYQYQVSANPNDTSSVQALKKAQDNLVSGKK